MPRLQEVPSGVTFFVDANIFLEHLLQGHPLCTAFFHRLRVGEIRAVTSVVVLAEVRHRLLLTEITRRGYVSEPRRALTFVRAHPEVLSYLRAADDGLHALLEIPIRIVSVTPAQFRVAQRLSLRHRLLTNDALHLAVLRAHRLRHLASADHDFRGVPNLTLWSP